MGFIYRYYDWLAYNKCVCSVKGITDSIRFRTLKLSTLLFLTLFVGNVSSDNNNLIPYCVDPNWLPYEAIEGNQHIGLSAGYMKIIEAKSEFEFMLIPTKDWQQSLDYLQTGQCLLLPMLNKTPDRSTYLDFSDTYFSSPNFLVSTLNQPFLQSLENIDQKTLGVTQGYRVTEFITKNHPNINTQTYKTEVDGLKAVANGDVDLFIGSVHSINSHIQTLGLSNLKLAGWGGTNDSLRVGVKKGQDDLLAEINAILKQITQQQHFEIYNRWNDVAIIDNTNYRLAWQTMIGSAFLVALLLIRYLFMYKYNRKLTNKNRQLSELQLKLLQINTELQQNIQQDALTGLYNRHYFNELIADKTYQNDGEAPLSLIFLDLDFFKKINDNHGHTIGDNVLKSFGQLLKSCCVEDELICRWGGEEFIILKQNAKAAESENLCVRIQKQMEQHTFPHKEPLTCSFGIAQMVAGETLMDCFEHADKMLYQAKSQGRDCICVSM